jgi:hypothetical protein
MQIVLKEFIILFSFTVFFFSFPVKSGPVYYLQCVYFLIPSPIFND